MVEKNIQIMNQMGLHARPAAKIVKLTSQFKSQIKATKDGFTINAKSILGLMSLAAERGSIISLHIDGEDEEKAMMAIVNLFEEIFNEE